MGHKVGLVEMGNGSIKIERRGINMIKICKICKIMKEQMDKNWGRVNCNHDILYGKNLFSIEEKEK